MIQSAAENACLSTVCRTLAEDILEVAGIPDYDVQVFPNNIDATTEVITVTADIPITGRNNFGISAFFSGRVLRKEISLPRQLR